MKDNFGTLQSCKRIPRSESLRLNSQFFFMDGSGFAFPLYDMYQANNSKRSESELRKWQCDVILEWFAMQLKYIRVLIT